MKVLILENINLSAVNLYKQNGYKYTHLKSGLSERELIERIKDVDVLCIRSKTKVTKFIIDNAPNLKIIGCYCIGTNQVDLEYCKKYSISVVNSPYMSGRSVAELVISHIISLARASLSHILFIF